MSMPRLLFTQEPRNNPPTPTINAQRPRHLHNSPSHCRNSPSRKPKAIGWLLPSGQTQTSMQRGIWPGHRQKTEEKNRRDDCGLCTGHNQALVPFCILRQEKKNFPDRARGFSSTEKEHKTTWIRKRWQLQIQTNQTKALFLVCFGQAWNAIAYHKHCFGA